MGSYRFNYENDIALRKPIIKYELPNIVIKVLSDANQIVAGTPTFRVYYCNTETNHEKLETFIHGRDAITRANELYEEHQKGESKNGSS